MGFFQFFPQYKGSNPSKSAKGIDFCVKSIGSSNSMRNTKIFIECKSGETLTLNAGLKQLKEINDRENADYLILVANNIVNYKDFNIRYEEKEKVFVVKPYYVGFLINAIKTLLLKYKKIIDSLENKSLELKQKADLISTAESIKEKFLKNGSFKFINNDLDNIKINSQKIEKSNQEIFTLAEKIKNRHLKSLTNKLEQLLNIEFKKKIIDKLSNKTEGEQK